MRFLDGEPPSPARHIVFYRRDALSHEMKRELEAAPPLERLGLAEPWLDAGHGDWDLTNVETASPLKLAIRRSIGRYRLLAWCIMPSHVHVLIVEHAGVDLTEIVRGWMDSTWPLHAPSSSHRSPLVWDTRFFADAGSGNAWIAAMTRHIESNPVAAGLASSREAWRWSSASMDLAPPRSRPQPRSRPLAPPPAPLPPPSDPTRRASHVIFWLNDALSGGVLRDLARRPPGQRLRVLDKALDEGRGRRSLAGRTAAAHVRAEILAGDGEGYGLIAWCVMPTHVHVLFSERAQSSPADIVAGWRSRTVAAANTRRLFRIDVSPWATAYTRTDLVGDDDIEDAKSYIEYNPVMTGLARTPDAWPWSSASDTHSRAARP